MKKYKKPRIEITVFAVEDITTSGFAVNNINNSHISEKNETNTIQLTR